MQLEVAMEDKEREAGEKAEERETVRESQEARERRRKRLLLLPRERERARIKTEKEKVKAGRQAALVALPVRLLLRLCCVTVLTSLVYGLNDTRSRKRKGESCFCGRRAFGGLGSGLRSDLHSGPSNTFKFGSGTPHSIPSLLLYQKLTSFSLKIQWTRQHQYR